MFEEDYDDEVTASISKTKPITFSDSLEDE
jgi:hypothetical protein